jgi:hypothetical protein
MLYRPGQQGPGGSAGLGASHVDQVITNAAPLPFPLEAKLDRTGESVTLVQTCNWQGQSPANIGIDRSGKQFLATFDEVTVTAAGVIPNPALDAIRMGRAPGQSDFTR